MKFDTVINDIETHPMLVAIAFFLVVFIGYNVLKSKKVSNTSTVPSLNTNPGINPTTSDTITNYSFPIISNPPVTPIQLPPNTPVDIPPTRLPSQPTSNPVIVPINPVPVPPLPVPLAEYVTVTTWPHPGSSLWSIALEHGISLNKIEQLNPQYSGNWNLIHPGDRVRVA